MFNLCRSYTALADVVSLFVVLPLMVKSFGFHDMTIVICAVSAQVSSLIICSILHNIWFSKTFILSIPDSEVSDLLFRGAEKCYLHCHLLLCLQVLSIIIREDLS